MADANTGSVGVIRIDVSESALNPGANTSTVNYAFYLIELRGTSNQTFGNGKSASVDWAGVGTLWSGTFNFDWRAAGQQTTLIVASSFGVTHNPDGSGSVTVQGNMGATGTSGAGGPTSVAQGLTLTKLTQIPGTPTGVTATRVSDTQVGLSWSQSNASNGQPTATKIEARVNGGAWATVLTIGGATSTTLSASPNQKLEYRVTSSNAAGSTPVSAASAPIFTTPADPSGVTAIKDATLNIVVAFTDNTAYTEHTSEIWHGTVTGGVTTWDGAALATLPSGTTSYTHNAPNASQVHVYKVRSVAGSLASGYSVSNTVQLLVAPNKPTVAAMGAFADKAAPLEFAWTHNPQDTTPQTAYEFSTSTDGGTTWASSGKITSGAQSRTIAASTYAAGVALTTRVRTWGSATTGGSDGTGASPWSDLRTVTYKTAPTASITSPADGSTYTDAVLRVTVGFTQPEAATFVKAHVQLLQGATVLEEFDSAIQVGVTFTTPVQNGVSYSVKAKVQDSNGLWSSYATSSFDVVYLAPVPAVVVTSYLPNNGFGQLDLTIASPGSGQSAATTVTITRTILGVEEIIVKDYPVSAALTFLDTTPTINGTNDYKITTTSALGAQSVVAATLVTTELRRAYLSKGPGFASVVVFGANLSVDESLGVASDTVEAEGRTKPIGLYGVETTVQLKVQSFIYEGFGSTIPQLRDLLLIPGKACYRDSSGRRVFGAVKGGVSYNKATRGDFSFSLTETSN